MFADPRRWFADVRFACQDGTVWAHAGVVSCRSPSMGRMLAAATRSTDGLLAIEAGDVRVAVLATVLRFVYLGRAGAEEGCLMECLSAADYYELPAMREALEHELIASLTLSSCCRYAQQALELCEDAILERCVAFLCENAAAVVAVPPPRCAVALPHGVLSLVLASDAFCAPDELAVARFLVERARSPEAPADEELLPSLLGHVRLTHLDPHVLEEVLEPTGLFDPALLSNAYKCIALGKREAPRMRRSE